MDSELKLWSRVPMIPFSLPIIGPTTPEEVCAYEEFLENILRRRSLAVLLAV